MADWREMVVDLVLADGVIEDGEGKVLKKGLYEDGTIDRKEVEFLVELRNKAHKKAKGAPLSGVFEKFFFKAVEDYVLGNDGVGIISLAESKWLRTMLYADKKIDDGEKKFLATLKKKATKTNAAFDKLCEEVGV